MHPLLTASLILIAYSLVVYLFVKVISSGSTEDNLEEQAVKFWDRKSLHEDIFLNQN